MSTDGEHPLFIDEDKCDENSVGSESITDTTTKNGVNGVAREQNADLSTSQVHENTNGYNAQFNDLQSKETTNKPTQSSRRHRALSMDSDVSSTAHRQSTSNKSNNENNHKNKERSASEKKRKSLTNGDKNHKSNHCSSSKSSSSSRSLFTSKPKLISFPQNNNAKKQVLNVSYLFHSQYTVQADKPNKI